MAWLLSSVSLRLCNLCTLLFAPSTCWARVKVCFACCIHSTIIRALLDSGVILSLLMLHIAQIKLLMCDMSDPVEPALLSCCLSTTAWTTVDHLSALMLVVMDVHLMTALPTAHRMHTGLHALGLVQAPRLCATCVTQHCVRASSVHTFISPAPACTHVYACVCKPYDVTSMPASYRHASVFAFTTGH